MECLKAIFEHLFYKRAVILSFRTRMRVTNICNVAGNKSNRTQNQENVSPRLGARRSGVFKIAVYIKDDEGKEARVRLLGIDAPESKQAYGVQSAEHLKRNLRDAEYHVQVIYRGRDQYGRIIGKLVADGKDLNLDQVSTGNAWVYRNYLKDLQPGDKNLYLKAEDNARAKRIGLWADPNPQNPRDWRREHPRN